MALKPDWNALGRLFNEPAREAPSASQDDYVTYLGERMPKWLARDLIQERAAFYEYEAGMTREQAEAEARKGLEK